MGDIQHEALLITSWDRKVDAVIQAFRQEMPETWRGMLVGPLPSLLNGYTTYLFGPEGSKLGWGASREGRLLRDALVETLRGEYADIVKVRWGVYPASVVEHRIEEEELYG